MACLNGGQGENWNLVIIVEEIELMHMKAQVEVMDKEDALRQIADAAHRVHKACVPPVMTSTGKTRKGEDHC